MPADPPTPVPPFLQPLGVSPPLGPGDLLLVATRDELAAICAACVALDLDLSILRVVHRDGSPWIEFVAVRLDRQARAWSEVVGAAATGEPQRFALWRYTLAVYRIGDDGAVEDDPVWRPNGVDG